jgi:hypothetical protein
MGARAFWVATTAIMLTGCPLTVDDPYEIRKPDANSGSGGSGAPNCADGVKNGAETDRDCGGNSCPRCADGRACNGNSDCQSDSCSSDICEP